MPEFKMADLVHDFRALETARQDAEKMLATDSFWTDPEYKFLREDLEQSGALSHERMD
jgi:ATP-dependent DNA helicase RecG